MSLHGHVIFDHRNIVPHWCVEQKWVLVSLFLPQNANNKKKIKQDSNTKANKSGEEAQKKPWGL